MTAEGDIPEDTSEGKARRRVNRQRKPPLTIDLPPGEVTEAAPEPVAEASEGAPADTPFATGEPPPAAASATPSPHPAPQARRASFVGLTVAALIGGTVATALGIAWHASGIVPTRSEIAANEAREQALSAGKAVEALGGRIASLEARPEGANPADLADLSGMVTAIEASLKGVTARLDALEARPASSGVAVAAPVTDAESLAFAELEARVAEIESTIRRLEGSIAAVAARPPPGESEKAARTVAIGVVRQAASKNAPFAADLAMLETLGLDPQAVASLRDLAEQGAPTIGELQAGFPAVAERILGASAAADAGEGFFGSIAAFGRSLVSIRPVGPMEGGTTEAVISRMQAAIDEADLATALSERVSLPAIGQAASAAWAEAATNRLAIDKLIDQLVKSAPAN